MFYLGYAKKVREIQIGANIGHYYQKVVEYNSIDAVTFNLGAIWHNMIFTHGLSYKNISHTTSKSIELPVVIKYELMLSPFDKTQFALSFEKEKHFDERYGFGVKQKVTDYFYVNSGFLTNPNQFSAGIVVRYNQFDIGYGVRTHTELDMTHAIGIKWQFAPII
jgi:hypothetical protein